MTQKRWGITVAALLWCCLFSACRRQTAPGDHKEQRASGARGPLTPASPGARGDEIEHRIPQEDIQLARASLKRWTVMKTRYVGRVDGLLSEARNHLQDHRRVMAIVGKLEVLTFHCVHMPPKTGIHAAPERMIDGWKALWDRRRDRTAMDNLIHGLLDRSTCAKAWQPYLTDTLRDALKDGNITSAQLALLSSGLDRLKNLKRKRTLREILHSSGGTSRSTSGGME